LNECGYKNVDYRLVKDCRHEIFNDIKQDEVMNDFVKWVNNVLNMN